MNKQVSLILNIVLLVAVAALFYLQLGTGKSGAADGDMVENDSAEQSVVSTSIAYITIDSLTKNYTFWTVQEEKLKARTEKLQSELENRVRGFQQEVQTLQNTAMNMTQNQYRAAEENLARKQQNLQQYQSNIQNQLLQEESAAMEEVYDKVSSFLEEYGKKHNLELILTYQRGSGVWYAREGMNITNDVIAGLNKAYEMEQNGGTATDAAPADSTSAE